MCSIVERETYEHPHNAIVSLKAAFFQVMPKMCNDHLVQSWQYFWFHTEEVIETEGRFIE